MIPSIINRQHLLQAIQQARREGIPRGRQSRDYCLTHDSGHYPPKYIIAMAHNIARGRLLKSDEFNGGRESNDFLRSREFTVVECTCGGIGPSTESVVQKVATSSSGTVARPLPTHSERCPECKVRIGQMLERIYGTCLRDHRFPWSAQLSDYRATPIFSTLNAVLDSLEAHRGHRNFVKARQLDPCDFFVPEPGFIVEIDESQHFTVPRRLALSHYPPDVEVGFSVDRWISLCDKHNAKDNNPPYRDEQRAWYDTLRDLVPALHRLRPTVRLYAREVCWCSLDPGVEEDTESMKNNLPVLEKPCVSATDDRTASSRVFRVGIVFPPLLGDSSTLGVAANTPTSQKPRIPSAGEFGKRPLGLIVFPEAYVQAGDTQRRTQLISLAEALQTHLLVGAHKSYQPRLDYRKRRHQGQGWQVLVLYSPNGSCREVYTKHTTAGAVAFEDNSWNAQTNLPVLAIDGVKIGATICHDSYLGGLQRHLRCKGSQIWINPSYDNPVEEKWEAILRLRAIELGIPTLCTLHQNLSKRARTHPFGFSPDGRELLGYQPGWQGDPRPLSQCRDPGIYIVDIELPSEDEAGDMASLPRTRKQPGHLSSHGDVKIGLRAQTPLVFDGSSWVPVTGSVVRIGSVKLLVTLLLNQQILDVGRCIHALHRAYQQGAVPVFWNAWTRLPADPDQMANVFLGRVLESCAPFILSDLESIHAVFELANQEKNLRWSIPRAIPCDEAAISLERAWGLRNSFAMVSKHLVESQARRLFQSALQRYLTLI